MSYMASFFTSLSGTSRFKTREVLETCRTLPHPTTQPLSRNFQNDSHSSVGISDGDRRSGRTMAPRPQGPDRVPRTAE